MPEIDEVSDITATDLVSTDPWFVWDESAGSDAAAMRTLTPGVFLDWLRARDITWTGKQTFDKYPRAQTGRAATVVVAASDSPQRSKDQADYVCDGTDDHTDIQNAVDALPSTGGAVHLLSGKYQLNGPVTLYEGTSLQGEGRGEATVLYQNSVGDSHLQGDDAQKLFVRNMTLRGPGINESSGGGIDFDRTDLANLEAIILQNLLVEDIAGTGISLNNLILSRLEDVRTRLCANRGINIYNGGTSTCLISCYASGVLDAGIRMSGHAYASIMGCASESCGIGYELDGCFNITLQGCGSEEQTDRDTDHPGTAYKFDGGLGHTIMSCYSRDAPEAHVHVAGSDRITITGLRVVNDAITPDLDDIKIDSGSGSVTLVESPASIDNDSANAPEIVRGQWGIGEAEVRHRAVAYDCPDSTLDIADVADGYAVTDVWVEVTTPWDGTASLDIGDSGNASGFLANADIDLTTTGYYGIEEDNRGPYLWDSTNGHGRDKVYTSSATVGASNSSDGTQGEAIVYVKVTRIGG